MPVTWFTMLVMLFSIKCARTEMLRQHDFHQHALMRSNVTFVTRRIAVKYFAPVRLYNSLQKKEKSSLSSAPL